MIAALLVSVLAYELRAGVTPVQKVLTMMEEMKTNGKAEMATEAKLHREYQSWCSATANTKEDAIREGGALMEKLAAQIQKANAERVRLGDEVTELDGAIAKMTADKKSSSEIRAKERADYETVHQDYTESVDAMGGALSTLANVAGNKANALMQTTVAGLPFKVRTVLQSFLETDQPSGAPAGNAYESSVGSVVGMIEQLQEKLKGERSQLEKDEANAKHGYQMVQQQLTMSLEQSADERDSKAERKANRAAQSAADTRDLAETTATKDADVKYLSELQALCMQKHEDFSARQVLRGEELEAIQKAIDIIGDKAVSGAADKHLPAFVQSFAQLRASSSTRTKVAAALAKAASSTKSKALAMVAQQVKLGGHFDKVVQMIKDMIAKLTEEAAEEAEHKGWCDGELHDNKNTRDAKTEAIDQLMALSEKLSADLAKLSAEMQDLQEQIAELDSNVAEATAQRQKEKQENTVAVKDAKAAAVAVRQAIGVLKEFYAKAGKATALVQGPGDDAPQSFDTPYTGMGGASGGVLGMLDVILSDFVRLDEETTAEEGQAAKEFDSFSAESSSDRQQKADSLSAKDSRSKSQAKARNQAAEDLKRTQAELDSATEYHAELKTACVDANVSFEERVARREEEIESLREALKALSDE